MYRMRIPDPVKSFICTRCDTGALKRTYFELESDGLSLPAEVHFTFDQVYVRNEERIAIRPKFGYLPDEVLFERVGV